MGSPKDEICLSVEGVTKRYPRQPHPAVRDVSFELEEGELFALVGASGSGKTTLLRLIAGLERPDQGKIRMRGSLLSGKNQFVKVRKRQMGLVFQNYALFPHFTALENVKYGIRSTPDQTTSRTSFAREWLEKVGLDEKFNAYPHELSGGQQQRVALARALAAQPSLLMLDEPFSNLDAELRGQMRSEIRRIIKESGLTALFVTHDTRDALATADRLAVLREGALLQLGTAREIYESPVNDYVARFFGLLNEVQLHPIPGGWESPFGPVTEDRYVRDRNGEKILQFRPEDAQISLEPAELSGILTDQFYFGDHQQLILQGREGPPITLKIERQFHFEIGQRLYFSFR